MEFFARVLISITLLSGAFAQPTPYTLPPSASRTSANLWEQKIYFLSGGNALSDLFYLDLTQNFDISKPPLFLAETSSPIPFVQFAATSISGAGDNATIWIFGGTAKNSSLDDTDRFLSINLKSSSVAWSTPSSQGPSPRSQIQSVIDKEGRMYIWGGSMDDSSDSAMYILDTTSLSWTSNIVPDPPKARQRYSVNILPDGKILYIGGLDADLREILVYDTNKTQSPWTTRKATNDTAIDSRYDHTSSLTPDGKSILVLGGSGASPQNNILLLDLSTFKYSAVRASGAFPGIPRRHSATVYNDYMIVAFGDSTSVYLLDISSIDNLKWVDTFVATSASGATPSNTGSEDSPNASTALPSPDRPTNKEKGKQGRNAGVIAGATVGTVVGVSMLAAIGFCLYRRQKNQRYLKRFDRHFSMVISSEKPITIPVQSGNRFSKLES